MNRALFFCLALGVGVPPVVARTITLHEFYTPVVSGRLAILYDLEKLVDGGDLVTLPANEGLAAGEYFRLRIAANVDGFLFILNRNASGDVDAFFRPPGGPRFKILKFGEYLVPHNSWFRLDEGKGSEEIWIMVSPKALSDLERDLQGRSETRSKSQ